MFWANFNRLKIILAGEVGCANACTVLAFRCKHLHARTCTNLGYAVRFEFFLN